MWSKLHGFNVWFWDEDKNKCIVWVTRRMNGICDVNNVFIFWFSKFFLSYTKGIRWEDRKSYCMICRVLCHLIWLMNKLGWFKRWKYFYFILCDTLPKRKHWRGCFNQKCKINKIWFNYETRKKKGFLVK